MISKKKTEFIGPDYKGCTSEDYSITNRIFIRAYKYDKTKSVEYQVYIQDAYFGNWRYYDKAYNSDGIKMDFLSIYKEVKTCTSGQCALEEHVALNVTPKYLLAHQNTGIQVKISGINGWKVCSLPENYLKAFLSVVK